MSKIFKHKDFNLVVYVEDTDFQGFVYHANYIKYFERARSDFLISNNISQIELRKLQLGFVIKSIEINYLLPATLGEELTVQTLVTKKSKARFIFNQDIYNSKTSEKICSGFIEACLVNIETKKPKPFPNDLLLIFDNGEVNE
jgi:tol-pal system-associated acyl-CoA thioesterase